MKTVNIFKLSLIGFTLIVLVFLIIGGLYPNRMVHATPYYMLIGYCGLTFVNNKGINITLLVFHCISVLFFLVIGIFARGIEETAVVGSLLLWIIYLGMHIWNLIATNKYNKRKRTLTHDNSDILDELLS